MSGNKIEQTNSVLLERLEKEEMAKESFMKDVMLFKQKYKELEEENRVLKEMVEGRKKLGKGEKVEKVDRGQWPQSSRHVRGLQQYEKTVQ